MAGVLKTMAMKQAKKTRVPKKGPQHPEEMKRRGLYVRSMIADLYLANFSQRAIARRLDIADSRVSVILKELREEWQRERKEAIDGRCADMLQKLQQSERLLYVAWVKSCLPKIRVHVEPEEVRVTYPRGCKPAEKKRIKARALRAAKEDAEREARAQQDAILRAWLALPVEEMMLLNEAQDGNPKILAERNKTLRQISDLLGLDAPKKLQVGGDPDGVPIGLTSPLDDMAEWRRRPIEERFDAIKKALNGSVN